MFKRIGKIILMVLGGFCLGVVMAFVFGWIVMLLWNWLMPPIFGVTAITFWQAWGLVILANLLFKAGLGHQYGHEDHFHPHWKRTFKEKMKEHFGEGCCTPSSFGESKQS